MRFVAFLDADVLCRATLRDVLLQLAEDGVYQIRWSPDVLDEMERHVARLAKAPKPSVAAKGAAYLRSEMERAFPDAIVRKASYLQLVPTMTNDPKDRHVLAAAIAGRADVLVTANMKHFPAAACEPYEIDVQDPDTFLEHQFGLAPHDILTVLDNLARERRAPLNTAHGILSTLERTVPRFCHVARAAMQAAATGK